MYAPRVPQPAAPRSKPKRPAAPVAKQPRPSPGKLAAMRGQIRPVHPAGPAVLQASPRPGKGQDAGLERQADLVAERLTRPAAEQVARAPPLTAAPSGGTGRAPASVRKVVQSAGQPLAAPTRRGFEAGLGRDLGSVRIHDNARADAAAASLGALAFTFGSDIGFRAGRFAPDTQAGRTLLAHELAHVAQQGASPRLQLKDDPAKKPKKKVVAKQDEGRWFAVRITPTTVDEQLLPLFKEQYGKLNPGAASRKWEWSATAPTITAEERKDRRVLVIVRDSTIPKITPTAGKKQEAYYGGLEKEEQAAIKAETDNEFRRQSNFAANEKIDKADPKNAAAWKAIRNALIRQHQAVEALPEEIRAFLFDQEGLKVDPADLKTVLAIAANIAAMSAAERAEYKSRTTAVTTDWGAYLKSIESFLAEIGEREVRADKRAATTAKLSKLSNSLYEKYLDFKEAFANQRPLVVSSDGDVKLLSVAQSDLNKELVAAGFLNYGEVDALIAAHKDAFVKEAAYSIAVGLDRYVHMLRKESDRYKTPGQVEDLAQAVGNADAAADYDKALKYKLLGLAGNNMVLDLIAQQAAMVGKSKVVSAAPGHPLVHQPGFDLHSLTHAPKEQVKRVVFDDIRKRFEAVATIKSNLGDPSLIFGNDEIFKNALEAQGIVGNPVLEKILWEHKKKEQWKKLAVDLAKIILFTILGIITEGAGFAALAVTGVEVIVSAVDVLKAYDEFMVHDAAYTTGFESEPADPTALVLSILGGLTDLNEFRTGLKLLAKNADEAAELGTKGLKTGSKNPHKKTKGSGKGNKGAKAARKEKKNQLKREQEYRTRQNKEKARQQGASGGKPAKDGASSSELEQVLGVGAKAIDVAEIAMGLKEIYESEAAIEKIDELVKETEEIVAKGRKLGLSDRELLGFVKLRLRGMSAAEVETVMKAALGG